MTKALTLAQWNALADFRREFHLAADMLFIPVAPQFLDSIEQGEIDARAVLVGINRSQYPLVELHLQKATA